VLAPSGVGTTSLRTTVPTSGSSPSSTIHNAYYYRGLIMYLTLEKAEDPT
jgi:hypothetical protein